DSLLNALELVRNANFVGPLTGVLNPSDLLKLVQEKDANGQALYDDDVVAVFGDFSFVPSTLVAAGTAYFGSFSEAGAVYTREETPISVADSHQDYFTRGIVVILAEARAQFALYRPSAICKVTAW